MLAMRPVAREVLVEAFVMLRPHAATSSQIDVMEDVLLTLPVNCDKVLLTLITRFAHSPIRPFGFGIEARKERRIARVRELTLSAIARAGT
jgi:hypothetical protein